MNNGNERSSIVHIHFSEVCHKMYLQIAEILRYAKLVSISICLWETSYVQVKMTAPNNKAQLFLFFCFSIEIFSISVSFESRITKDGFRIYSAKKECATKRKYRKIQGCLFVIHTIFSVVLLWFRKSVARK